MFINYFKDCVRGSPLNLLVARIVLGSYGLWKMASVLVELAHLNTNILSIYSYSVTSETLISFGITILPLTSVISLILFTVGYRVKTTSLLAGISIILLSTLLGFSGLYRSISTLSHLLLIYSLFAEDDKTSFKKFSLRSLKKQHLKNSGEKNSLRFLKWMLVYLAFTYFLTAVNRLVSSGITRWMEPSALARTIKVTFLLQGKQTPLIVDMLISEPLIMILGVIITFLAEIGFLLTVVRNKSIDHVVTVVLGLHIFFAAAMNLYTLNQVMLITLLLPWDSILEKIHQPTKN